LVRRFEGFGYALLLGHSSAYALHAVVAGLVDFGKMFKEFAAEEQDVVDGKVMLLEVAAAHTAIFAEPVCACLGKCDVGDEILPLMAVGPAHAFVQ